MILPSRPPAWANLISGLLQAIEQNTGESMYPVRVKNIAFEVSKHFFPHEPITEIYEGKFNDRFEGALLKIPNENNKWSIIYNSAIKSSGRINFTLAHELGHYLLHRQKIKNEKIECSRRDMVTWNSEYGQMEAEANEFASYLLMPINLFKEKITGKEISLHLLQSVADFFDVSLTAAILKWLQFTDKRAMLVMGDNGFVKWVWSSDSLRKSGVYLQPKKDLIELPQQSLAIKRDVDIDGMSGVLHPSGIWPFKEDVKEMTLNADAHEMSITLLLFSDNPPIRHDDENEEPDLVDRLR